MIEASAPGKLFLAGEYAVLYGAPGIALAVDVRATASVAALAGDSNRLIVPEHNERADFAWRGSQPAWAPGLEARFRRTLEAAALALARAGRTADPSSWPNCEIELSTAAFSRTGATGQSCKLGLGSSAAIVVSCVAALRRLGPKPAAGAEEILELACDAHRELQGGLGSGIDVATSVFGGVLTGELLPGEATPRVTPLDWPPALRVLAIWTGQSASTRAMIDRLRAFEGARPSLFGERIADLRAAALATRAAWLTGEPGAILDRLSAYDGALRRLDVAANLGIYSAEHEALASLARTAGAVYKPSGAGGGDFGLVLSDSPDRIAAVRSAAHAADYLSLDVGPDVAGLRVRGEVAAPDRAPQ